MGLRPRATTYLPTYLTVIANSSTCDRRNHLPSGFNDLKSLYQPPVESDIKSRPSADKIYLQRAARGIIRASRANQNNEQQRERRRRMLAGLDSRRRSPPADAPTGPSASSEVPSLGENTEIVRVHALRDMASQMRTLDERVVAMFGERWAHLHAESNSPLRDTDDDRGSPSLTTLPPMAVEPEFFSGRRRLGLLPSEPYTISNMRSTQAPSRSSRSPGRSSVRIRRVVRERDSIPLGRLASSDRALAAYQAGLLNINRSRDSRRRGETQPPAEPLYNAPVDGLGDRNRSLSPEGDNVWDTLLSTLTPDPQPPSVGSSFVSAPGSGSAAASQTAVTRSSATSFAAPDTIEESAFEQPCESACENSDTEGDEDEEAEQNPLIRFPPVQHSGQLSYADVVSRSGSFDDPLDTIGDIRSMQRIVRTLANREDIPDEWWAQVGLSRTLSREASTS